MRCKAGRTLFSKAHKRVSKSLLGGGAQSLLLNSLILKWKTLYISDPKKLRGSKNFQK